MAAIGKIRSWGTVLIVVIGLALFAFIAEEFVRSTETMRNDSRQQIGEVMGKKISVHEFQALLDEYQEVIKMTQGRENLTEEELNQVKDMVWNTYVQNTIIDRPGVTERTQRRYKPYACSNTVCKCSDRSFRCKPA